MGRYAVGLAVALLALSGCSADKFGPHPAPRSLADCNELFHLGDAGAGAGLDWSTEMHRYDHSATLYACYNAPPGAAVKVEASKGARVTPDQALVGRSSIVPFKVTVHPGARSGALSVTYSNSPGHRFGNALLPKIVTESDGWHFAPGE